MKKPSGLQASFRDSEMSSFSIGYGGGDGSQRPLIKQ